MSISEKLADALQYAIDCLRTEDTDFANAAADHCERVLVAEASRQVDGDMVERAINAFVAKANELAVAKGKPPCALDEAKERMGDDWEAVEQAFAAALATALQQKEEAERDLLNLLATIHRDGGQYAAEHGREKAVQDAIVLSSERIGALENLFEACRIHDPDDWTGEPAMIEAALILKKPPFDKEPKQ